MELFRQHLYGYEGTNSPTESASGGHQVNKRGVMVYLTSILAGVGSEGASKWNFTWDTLWELGSAQTYDTIWDEAWNSSQISQVQRQDNMVAPSDIIHNQQHSQPIITSI